MRYECKLVFKLKTAKREIPFAAVDGGYESRSDDYPDRQAFFIAVSENVGWLGRRGVCWLECPDHPDADKKYGSLGYWYADPSYNYGIMRMFHKLYELVEKGD